MVGVMMRDQQTAHRFAAQRPVDQRLPDYLGAAALKAGINHSPAITIIQRIDVDMIQRHRQRQAQPKHMRCDFNRAGFGGGLWPRKVNGVGHAESTSGVTA